MEKFIGVLLALVAMILPISQTVQDIDISSTTIISYIESFFNNDAVEIYDDTPLSAASPVTGQDSGEAFLIAIILFLILGVIIYFSNREEH